MWQWHHTYLHCMHAVGVEPKGTETKRISWLHRLDAFTYIRMCMYLDDCHIATSALRHHRKSPPPFEDVLKEVSWKSPTSHTHTISWYLMHAHLLAANRQCSIIWVHNYTSNEQQRPSTTRGRQHLLRHPELWTVNSNELPGSPVDVLAAQMKGVSLCMNSIIY